MTNTPVYYEIRNFWTKKFYNIGPSWKCAALLLAKIRLGSKCFSFSWKDILGHKNVYDNVSTIRVKIENSFS